MSQIAFSFDRTSLKKIGKGALIATGSALVAYLANNVPAIADAFKDSPILASLVTAFAGIGLNIAKEYFAGAQRQALNGRDEEVGAKVAEIVDDIKTEAKEQVAKDVINEEKGL